MLSDFTVFAPIFLVLGIFLGFAPTLDRTVDRHRGLIALATMMVGLRYILWRLVDTVVPFQGDTARTVWVWGVYGCEVMAYVEACIFLLIMSRHNNQSRAADGFQAGMEAAGRYPAVDVFIPTYNEGLDVLEKTIIGAKHLDYPDVTVWILDDGRRPWLRDFCASAGVEYLTRPDNAHAKAGNMNNGLRHACGELVAIFDADFVPAHNFLRRTVGFFADPTIGIVQTPQHFFNKDPVQMNLLI